MKLVQGVILFVSIPHCVAILCYQCSDAGDSDRSECVRGVHAMSVERANYKRHQTTISSRSFLRNYPFLKNCSHYVDKTTGRSLYNYCKIERVYSGGNLNAYIRDCSSGEDFSADLNISRLSKQLGYLRPDNQSTCGYSQRHIANICVQICQGDFCNGPLAGQNLLSAQPVTIYFLAIIVAIRASVMKYA